MKTRNKNIILAIAIIATAVVVVTNSHIKQAAFLKEFDYQNAQATGLPVLLELGFQACPPCKMMKPVLKSLKKEHSEEFAIGYIDTITDFEAAKQYGIDVTPTLIFFDKEGKELSRSIGFQSEQQILEKWEDLGVLKTAEAETP